MKRGKGSERHALVNYLVPFPAQQTSNYSTYGMQMASTRQLHAILPPPHLNFNTFGHCSRDHP